MVASLNPDYGVLSLNPLAPRIWLGGPSSNCWRMYWNASLSQWELEGGNGLVRYTQSSTFDCNGPNVFDVLLVDLTLQAPSAITVYPLTPLPCTCPGMFEPEFGVLNLTPYPPSISSHLEPTLADLSLTPYPPEISTTTPCVSLEFANGLHNYVSTANYDSIGTNLTVSLWMKILSGSPQAYPFIFSQNAGGWGIFRDVIGGVRFSKGDFSNQVVAPGSVANDLLWHHFLLRYDGTTFSAWMDGASIGSAAVASTFSSGGIYTIGHDPTNRSSTARIMDLRLYNSDQTGNVAAIYNGGVPSFSDVTVGSITHWFKLGEGSGTTAQDSVSGGMSNNLVNSPVWTTDCP